MIMTWKCMDQISYLLYIFTLQTSIHNVHVVSSQLKIQLPAKIALYRLITTYLTPSWSSVSVSLARKGKGTYIFINKHICFAYKKVSRLKSGKRENKETTPKYLTSVAMISSSGGSYTTMLQAKFLQDHPSFLMFKLNTPNI